jgi:hypothetical protein
MRRAAAALLALLFVALVVAPLLAGCGGNADPFQGLYWEPASGRRVEIRKDGETYWLYYGADKQAFQAKRDGDELVIAEPMGGKTIVRKGDTEGTLELQTAGKTTQLRRLQQHQ